MIPEFAEILDLGSDNTETQHFEHLSPFQAGFDCIVIDSAGGVFFFLCRTNKSTAHATPCTSTVDIESCSLSITAGCEA